MTQRISTDRTDHERWRGEWDRDRLRRLYCSAVNPLR